MTEKHNGPYKIEIDYKKLDAMCAIQCTGEECAAILGISYDTLGRRLAEDGHGGFADYFKEKSAGGKMSLRRKQYELASSGNATMQIWLGKQWLEQQDSQKLVHSGEVTTFNMDFGSKEADADD